MATVNGNPNWQMSSATSMSELSTGGVVASSARGYRTLNRTLSVIMEEASKKDESGQPCLVNNQEDKEEG